MKILISVPDEEQKKRDKAKKKGILLPKPITPKKPAPVTENTPAPVSEKTEN